MGYWLRIEIYIYLIVTLVYLATFISILIVRSMDEFGTNFIYFVEWGFIRASFHIALTYSVISSCYAEYYLVVIGKVRIEYYAYQK